MNFIQLILLNGFAFVSSLLLTAYLRHYAIAHSILDLPNVRSSHTKVTPKGGGLAIVVIFLLALTFMFLQRILPANIFLALLGGGLIIAGVGWWDDVKHLAIPVRLFAQFLAGAWVLWWLGGLPPLDFGLGSINLGLFGDIIGIFALVWLINLYNFMDGIDAIAGIEAVCVAISAGILLTLSDNFVLVQPLWILVVVTVGFLVWNWPPARIFMGDAGSGFLGLVLGVFLLASAKQGVLSIWLWLILLGVFLVDATVTLLRRLVRGSPWHEAHRRHAYQHAARRWGHLRVILGITFLNLFWLAPLALIAWRYPTVGFAVMLLALIPLVFGAFYLKAGRESA